MVSEGKDRKGLIRQVLLPEVLCDEADDQVEVDDHRMLVIAAAREDLLALLRADLGDRPEAAE